VISGYYEEMKVKDEPTCRTKLSHEKTTAQIGSLTTEYGEWLTSAEAATYLRITKRQLFNLTSNGKIPYYKFGRSNRYRKDELRQLLLAQARGGCHGYKI
jgi:excisionase family DNA binding protein